MFSGIVLVILIVAIVSAIYAYTSATRQLEFERDPDREPQPNDMQFMANGADNMDEKYHEAHRRWEVRQSKKITYTMPISEILNYKDAELLYLQEVAIRNPKRHRLSCGGDDRVCQICGNNYNLYSLHPYLINKGVCEKCGEKLIKARQPNSGYKLPDGVLTFSDALWIDQMVVCLDLEDGVIDEAQAHREMEIILMFERQRVAKRERNQRLEQQKEQEQKQTDSIISNIANGLLE